MRAVGWEGWGVEDGYEGKDDGFAGVCDPHLGGFRGDTGIVKSADSFEETLD